MLTQYELECARADYDGAAEFETSLHCFGKRWGQELLDHIDELQACYDRDITDLERIYHRDVHGKELPGVKMGVRRDAAEIAKTGAAKLLEKRI